MPIETVRRAWLWLESVKDQVPANIRYVVQVSEPDLVAGGIAIDLLQVAKRIGPQCEAAEHEDQSGEKSLTQTALLLMIEEAIEPCCDNTEELSMKAPMSVSKPADLG